MTWFTVQCVVCRDEEFEVTKTIRVEAQNERQAAAMVCGGPLVQGETGASASGSGVANRLACCDYAVRSSLCRMAPSIREPS